VKSRRHHNTRGDRQLKTGAAFRQLVKIGKRLGIPVEGSKEVEQLKEYRGAINHKPRHHSTQR